MIKTEQKLGISGEFQVIVRNADGTIKSDTGMQPNLILDNGIKHYLGITMKNNLNEDIPHNNGLMNWCVVGTGNEPPTESDVKLQNGITGSNNTRDWADGKEEPTDTLHPGYVKLWKRGKFIFDNINNQNITELGLASYHQAEWIAAANQYQTRYKLMTRALVKDNSGTPIAVTVLAGEVLEVVYQINMFIDIQRKTGEFTLTTTKDGVDTINEFEYFLQPFGIGGGNRIDTWIGFNEYYGSISSWGVKETDDNLTSSYNLNDAEYQKINHLNMDALYSKISGNGWSGSNNSTKYAENYQFCSNHQADFLTKTRTVQFNHGIYTHVRPNGIRAYKWAPTRDDGSSIVSALVVVKNKANGQGIKKTDRQIWEHIASFTINRWV